MFFGAKRWLYPKPYYNESIEQSFPCFIFAKPECDNVLQPKPLSSESCNILLHQGLGKC